MNSANGDVQTRKTDKAGYYQFNSAAPGDYGISFEAKGLMPVVKNDITITTGAAISQNAVLRPRVIVRAENKQAIAPPKAIAEPMQPLPAQAVAPQNDQPQYIGPIPGGASSNYVTVNANAVAGPMGYAATPSLAGAAQSQSAQQQAFVAAQQFNFPSIIFYISAAPLVNLPATPAEIDKMPFAQETDRNPLWLDASFTLTVYDSKGALPNACSDGSVQVLGLLPQQTVAALKNQTAADIATGANDVAGALASFYPGGSQVSAATKAMNVIFQDIFPPQPVAYEYSNMTDNCNFGWYFRPNTSPTAGAGGAASILGTQTGIVLLKTSKRITKIVVNGRTISAWNKPPTSSNKKLYVGYDKPIGTIQLPDVTNIDYDNLTTLAMFPSLIPKDEAEKVLHITKDADFIAFAKANSLVGTDAAYDYVTNLSLSAFLGLSAPKEVAPAPAAPDKPVPAPAPKPAKPKPVPQTRK
jgi:hypothetical protein